MPPASPRRSCCRLSGAHRPEACQVRPFIGAVQARVTAFPVGGSCPNCLMRGPGDGILIPTGMRRVDAAPAAE